MFLTFYCIVLGLYCIVHAVNCRVKSEERAVTAGRAEKSMVRTVRKVQGWYEKSMERNFHGTKSPPMVRNVYGTKSLWYEKSGSRCCKWLEIRRVFSQRLKIQAVQFVRDADEWGNTDHYLERLWSLVSSVGGTCKVAEAAQWRRPEQYDVTAHLRQYSVS